MRLTYTCSVCKKQNYLKDKAGTRPELQMKLRGDEARVNCDHCGKMDKKHLNRISAVVDNRIVMAGFVIGLSIIVAFIAGVVSLSNYEVSFWKFLAFAGSAIAGIPVFLWNRENTAVRNFNQYAVKRN